MQEIIEFVSVAMVGGVIGNTTHDGLKAILGSSFDRLSSYLSNNEKAKFEGALEMLLEQNKELKEQIIDLQQGKKINKSFVDIKKSKIDINLEDGGEATNSFKKIDESTIRIR